jgi:hypothetical protein
MKAEALSKEIYDLAKTEGVTKITLNFSGGDDEGYLDVDVHPTGSDLLIETIDTWAWDTYSYSGAGCGEAFGDNITYDLKENTVTTQEWFTARSYSDEDEEPLQIEGDEK